MRFLVVGLPSFPPPPDVLANLVAAEPQWYERWRENIEVHGWFAGGGGFAILNVSDEAALNEAVLTHPFNAFSDTQIRAFVDHETGLRQLQEVVAAMGGA